MSDLPLITKYRPESFGEVIGHEAIRASLIRVLGAAQSRPHAYLFTGPSGIGKTTMARIIGKILEADILEVDAASNSGVEAMRGLVEFSQHMALSGAGTRLMIIDEAHALSRPAWQAILKLLEEPPPHLYLALCTTELIKVPETIQTRCFHCPLRPLTAPEIEDLLAVIADLEGWRVAPDVFQLAVQAGTGQPRKALTILQAIHDAPNRDEARRVIALVEASDPLIELFQHLLKGMRSWKQIRPLLLRIESETFEEAAIQAGRYLAAALVQTEDEKRAAAIWQMIEALVFPSETWDKKIAFIAALGRILWGGGHV
jgi:DNA polymerase-3 subunit gamma/tau